MSLTSCPSCGKVVSDMFPFCPLCGEKIIRVKDKENSEGGEPPGKHSRFPFLTVAITSGLALTILFILQFTGIIDLRIRDVGRYDESKNEMIFKYISSATHKGLIKKVDTENKEIHVDLFSWNHLNERTKKEAVNNFAAYMKIMGSETASVKVVDIKSENILAKRGILGTSLMQD